MKVRYLLTCLFVVKHVIPQNAQEINGDILARELNKVADSVGWSFLQVQLLKKNIFFNIFKFKTCDRITITNITVDNTETFGTFKKTKYIMKEPLNNYGA